MLHSQGLTLTWSLFVASVSSERYLAVVAENNRLKHALRREKRLSRQRLLRHPVTKLPNRELLIDILRRECARAKRREELFGVWFLDLDGFKGVNDSYGHAVGDRVLCMVRNRLQKMLRGEDVLAHVGGDEFVIVQMGARERICLSTFGERVVRIISSKPFRSRINEVSKKVQLGVSMGGALYPYDALTPNELLEKADTAMYEAKHGGKNQFVIYS